MELARGPIDLHGKGIHDWNLAGGEHCIGFAGHAYLSKPGKASYTGSAFTTPIPFNVRSEGMEHAG